MTTSITPYRKLPPSGVFRTAIQTELLKAEYTKDTITSFARCEGRKRRVLKQRTVWFLPPTTTTVNPTAHSLDFCWRHFQQSIIEKREAEQDDIRSFNDERPPHGSLILVYCAVARVLWPAIVVPPKYARLEMKQPSQIFGQQGAKYEPGASVVVRHINSHVKLNDKLSTTFKCIQNWCMAQQNGTARTWSSLSSAASRVHQVTKYLASTEQATACVGGAQGLEQMTAVLTSLVSTPRHRRVLSLRWCHRVTDLIQRPATLLLGRAEAAAAKTNMTSSATTTSTTSTTSTALTSTSRAQRRELVARLNSINPFPMPTKHKHLPLGLHYFVGAGFLLLETWLAGIFPALAIDCDAEAIEFLFTIIHQFLPDNPRPMYLTADVTEEDLTTWCSARKPCQVLLLVGFLGSSTVRRRGRDNVRPGAQACAALSNTSLDAMVQVLTPGHATMMNVEFFSSCCWDLTNANQQKDTRTGVAGLRWCVMTGKRHQKKGWTAGFVGENVRSTVVSQFLAQQKELNMITINELQFPVAAASRPRIIYSSVNIMLDSLASTWHDTSPRTQMNVARNLQLPKNQHGSMFVTGGSWSNNTTDSPRVASRQGPCVTGQPTFLSSDPRSKGRAGNTTDMRLSPDQRLSLLGWSHRGLRQKLFQTALTTLSSRTMVARWIGNSVAFGTGVMVTVAITTSVSTEDTLAVEHLFRYMRGR